MVIESTQVHHSYFTTSAIDWLQTKTVQHGNVRTWFLTKERKFLG